LRVLSFVFSFLGKIGACHPLKARLFSRFGEVREVARNYYR